MVTRLERLRERISNNGLDGFLVTDLRNVRYMTGFTGSAGVALITERDAVFMTDFRYRTQSAEQVKGFEIREYAERLDCIVDAVRSARIGRLGFEAAHVSYSTYKKMADAVGPVSAVPTDGLVEGLRLIKEPAEVEALERAASILPEALAAVKGMIKPGVREKDLAVELEHQLRRLGSEGSPFDIVVASGNRSALPHGAASDKILEEGELVTIDFGACREGYNSDTTRTFAVMRSDARQEEIYNIVLEANHRGIESVKPGLTAREVDAAARDLIDYKGFGEFFGHGTGHGVGLDVHEEPKIAREAATVIEEGMVFTIEPGIYIPGWGGVRIEDMILVTDKGCRVLTAGLEKTFEVV